MVVRAHMDPNGLNMPLFVEHVWNSMKLCRRGTAVFSLDMKELHVCGCSGENLAVIPRDLSASLTFPVKGPCLDSGVLGFPRSLNTPSGTCLDHKLKISVPRTLPVGGDS